MTLTIQLWKNTTLFPKIVGQDDPEYFAVPEGKEHGASSTSPYGLGVNLYANLPLETRDVIPDFIDAQSGRRTDSKLGVIARAPLTVEEIRQVVEGYTVVRGKSSH